MSTYLVRTLIMILLPSSDCQILVNKGAMIRCPDLLEVEEDVGSFNITCIKSLETNFLSIISVVSQDGTATGIIIAS